MVLVGLPLIQFALEEVFERDSNAHEE